MSKQIEYSDKVNAEFSEAIYQEMASIRYGVNFCCDLDLLKWSIKKELLDLNNLKINFCFDPDNLVQPGDPTFVPGPCRRLDIAYSLQGGSITYVPCNSYIYVTENYTTNDINEETTTICHDTNIGYTFDPFDNTTLIITETNEECID
jgi:hypothetical protein